MLRAPADFDDNRLAAAVRRFTTCSCLVALAGCSAPLYTEPVVSVVPPPQFGPWHSAANDVAPSSATTAGRAIDWPPADGGAAGRRTTAPTAPDFRAFAHESVGRLNLYVDPTLTWDGQEPQDPAKAKQEPQQPVESRWSDFLPLGRAEVVAAGYELPRAFGFGVAYTHLRRDIEVDEVRVGVDGAPPSTIDFLSVKADSVVDNVMGRLDAWIFPFWNVSLLGGWTWNESDSEVTVTVPFPGNPRELTMAVPTRQEGPTWGFGTNLAAGYGQWFISGDGQWIKADMQDFAVIEAFLGSIRSGWNGKVEGKPVRLWGGVTYWDTATTIEGEVVTSDGTVHFAVDQGPVTPYSLQVGGSVDFDRAYGIVLEGHLLKDVQMLVVSAALRF